MAVTSLREFFRDAFHAASEHHHLAIDENAEAYVVNLLTMFSRADALYERTPEGLRIRPLAHMLADALEAPNAVARQRGLQRLGDVSLFVAGFFARSFARKLIDIDYHIAWAEMPTALWRTPCSARSRGVASRRCMRSWRGNSKVWSMP